MNDDTADLLLMFQKLGTTDHDVLIKQFQTIVPGVDPTLCAFFLEASNWTLQSAIASFFDAAGDQDLKQQVELLNRPKPSAQFVFKDDGVSQYLTDTPFTKVWTVTNNGTIPWPEGCSLDFVSGDQLGGPTKIVAPALPPGTTVDITLNFRTPSQPGQFAGSWMMTTNGQHAMMFGEPIWVVIQAAQDPNSSIQAGWGGFGSVPFGNQGNQEQDADMTMG